MRYEPAYDRDCAVDIAGGEICQEGIGRHFHFCGWWFVDVRPEEIDWRRLDDAAKLVGVICPVH